MEFQRELIGASEYNPVYRLRGRFACAMPALQAEEFFRAFETASSPSEERASGPSLTLDCLELTTVCSSGIAWLLRLRELCVQNGREMVVLEAHSLLVEALDLLEIGSLFRSRDTQGSSTTVNDPVTF